MKWERQKGQDQTTESSRDASKQVGKKTKHERTTGAPKARTRYLGTPKAARLEAVGGDQPLGKARGPKRQRSCPTMCACRQTTQTALRLHQRALGTTRCARNRTWNKTWYVCGAPGEWQGAPADELQECKKNVQKNTVKRLDAIAHASGGQQVEPTDKTCGTLTLHI